MTSVSIKDLNGYLCIMEKVLDHGFVRLVDHMPRQDLDASIVQSARVSYGDGTKTPQPLAWSSSAPLPPWLPLLLQPSACAHAAKKMR